MFLAFYALAVFFIVFWFGLWIFHLTAIVHAKLKLHKRLDKYVGIPYPGITILKPLKGADANLRSNLETFFTMEYPAYELLFCVEKGDDPAVVIVKDLIARYPNVDATVYTKASYVGANPKINNMVEGYNDAKYDFIMISDSNIRLHEHALMDMAQKMEREDVGIVHQMPFSSDRCGWGAIIEKIYFGTAHARVYLFADYMGVNCHTGMSTLVRKELLDDVGGLQTFSCYLAEDFFMAKSVIDRGFKTKVSAFPAIQNPGYTSVRTFKERLKRWAKLRAAMVPFTIILEPLSECFVIGAIAAWALNVAFMWDPLIFYGIHVLVWMTLDYALLRVIQGGPLPFNAFYLLAGWIYREITGPRIFLSAFWSNKVRWQSRLYRVAPGGIAEEISPKMKI